MAQILSMLIVDVMPDGSPSSTGENSGMIIRRCEPNGSHRRIHRTIPEEQGVFNLHPY